MLDMILYGGLGVAVILQGLWGGVGPDVAKNTNWRLGGHVGLGFLAVVLTLAVGLRNYNVQKDANARQLSLQTSLDMANKQLGEVQAKLDKSTDNEHVMMGNLQMVGPMLAAQRGDTSDAIAKFGEIVANHMKEAGPIESGYHFMKASDLKQQTLTLVANLRTLVSQFGQQFSQIEATERSHEYPLNIQAEAAARNAANAQESALYDWLNASYNTRYKTDAKMLRDELMRREKIVLDEHQRQLSGMDYDFPTNSHGFTMVADDLEKMAKAIPESSLAKRHPR